MIEITFESVTPKRATTWLNSNTSNRKLRDGIAERYAQDMQSGNWTECPEPISFFEDGDLADGQHRLYAIVESGVTIRFPIARNVPRIAALNINTGLTRSLVDNGRISGVDVELSIPLISVTRAIEHGDSSNSTMAKRDTSNARRLEIVAAHREAARWALLNCPRGRNLNVALVMAAMARAWYVEENLARLEEFPRVLATGFANGEADSAAIALRNYLQLKGQTASLHLMWRDTFLRAQNAIWYFMQRRKLTLVKHIEEEAYPLMPRRKHIANAFKRTLAP